MHYAYLYTHQGQIIGRKTFNFVTRPVFIEFEGNIYSQHQGTNNYYAEPVIKIDKLDNI